MNSSDTKTHCRFHLAHRYLHIPVCNTVPKVRVILSCQGQFVTALDVEHGTRDEHDWMAVVNLSQWVGQTFDVHIENGDGPGDLVAQWFSADHTDDAETKDDCRPVLHFTAPRGWLNDPNGLVYYQGKYHLFYQHNPCGRQWGNMHWGHAISNDLIHWEHGHDELCPDATGTMYSGSAVVDHNNTSGLQSHPEHPPICLFYTAAGDVQLHQVDYTQRLAYSFDGGQTWQKRNGPALVSTHARGNRDPKVIFHQRSQRWVMVLYLEKRENINWFEILISRDLLHWESAGELSLPGSGECPDLFELPVDGDNDKRKWVFWAADGTYMVGDFDGKHFQSKQSVMHAYDGNSLPSPRGAYAAQTFCNLPDQRCVQLAWLRGQFPEHTVFNQQMTLPVELSLKRTQQGIRLAFAPVSELDAVFAKPVFVLSSGDGALSWEHPIDGPLHLCGRVRLSRHAQLQLMVGDLAITISDSQIVSQQTACELPASDVQFSLYIDTASAELFACDGLVYMPMFRTPLPEGQDFLAISISGDSSDMVELQLQTMA